MTKRLLAVAAVVAVALAGPALAQSQPHPAGFGDLARKLLPAVVNISTSQTIKADPKARPEMPDLPPGSPFEQFFKDFMDRQGQEEDRAPHKAISLGSGFVIDPSGLVVTNNHVIADADEISVILQDNTTLKAKLVGRDVKSDLALLRVSSTEKLTAVSFGDSDKERVGDWVVAVGNPFGLGGTVTSGIISARSREIGDSGPYDDFLQTDAAINRGNSGGPLFNLHGEVIGINTAIFSPSVSGGSIGIGFAIPSDLAKQVIGQIQSFGHVRRGYIGVQMQDVTPEVAQDLGLATASGALVAGVIDNGPAQKAGIQPGDIILSVGDRTVADPRHLERVVDEAAIDADLPVKLWRKRDARTVDVKIAELHEPDPQADLDAVSAKPGAVASSTTVKALGLSLSVATPELKEKYKLGANAMVVVTAIAKGGPASDRDEATGEAKDIKPGDVIVEVAQQEVKSVADVTRKTDAARKAGQKAILVLVDRAGELHFVSLRIDVS